MQPSPRTDPSVHDSSANDLSVNDLSVNDLSVTDERVSVAEGVALHVRRWGRGATGQPFLMVHGLASNARLWDEVAAIVAAAGHEVTAIDLRSHGSSDAPDAGYDTATAADDVAAVAHSLGIAGAVVAGQSWGGDVVVEVAARHPKVAAALALLDGGWSDLTATFPSWEACAAALRPADIDGMSAATMRSHFRDGYPDWSDAAIEASLANLAVGPDGTVSRRLSIPHHMQIVRSMWDDPPTRYYPDVHVPVLLMPALDAHETARRDRVAAAAGALEDATIREYVDADHDIHAEHPAQVAADLLGLAH
jgi:pimeloyl-ACP methyl ester carboxylesterase